MSGPVIQVEELGKTYSSGPLEVVALRDVSFSVRRGDFVAVMGSSGSGKTTLMNLLGCLDVPTRGRYLLDGIDVRTLSEDELADVRNRKIGFVFQGFNLIPRTRAIDNVELPLAYAGLGRSERRERAIRALSAVGLENRMEHVPATLSGGQQQRVALARAIVTNPSIVLADEPTGNLDSRSSADVLRVFARLNAQNRTIVLITHEEHVAAVAKRIVGIADGRIVRDTRLSGVRGISPGMRELLDLPSRGARGDPAPPRGSAA
jgi:putative ABC transport system ATP-binding protein